MLSLSLTAKYQHNREFLAIVRHSRNIDMRMLNVCVFVWMIYVRSLRPPSLLCVFVYYICECARRTCRSHIRNSIQPEVKAHKSKCTFCLDDQSTRIIQQWSNPDHQATEIYISSVIFSVHSTSQPQSATVSLSVFWFCGSDLFLLA